jgi:hypothetical protein
MLQPTGTGRRVRDAHVRQQWEISRCSLAGSQGGKGYPEGHNVSDPLLTHVGI